MNKFINQSWISRRAATLFYICVGLALLRANSQGVNRPSFLSIPTTNKGKHLESQEKLILVRWQKDKFCVFLLFRSYSSNPKASYIFALQLLLCVLSENLLFLLELKLDCLQLVSRAILQVLLFLFQHSLRNPVHLYILHFLFLNRDEFMSSSVFSDWMPLQLFLCCVI